MPPMTFPNRMLLCSYSTLHDIVVCNLHEISFHAWVISAFLSVPYFVCTLESWPTCIRLNMFAPNLPCGRHRLENRLGYRMADLTWFDVASPQLAQQLMPWHRHYWKWTIHQLTSKKARRDIPTSHILSHSVPAYDKWWNTVPISCHTIWIIIFSTSRLLTSPIWVVLRWPYVEEKGGSYPEGLCEHMHCDFNICIYGQTSSLALWNTRNTLR